RAPRILGYLAARRVRPRSDPRDDDYRYGSLLAAARPGLRLLPEPLDPHQLEGRGLAGHREPRLRVGARLVSRHRALGRLLLERTSALRWVVPSSADRRGSGRDLPELRAGLR